MSNSFAAENTAPALKAEPVKEEKKIDSNKLSSEENRKNLKYQLTIAFAGDEYGGVNPITMSAGYFINPNNLISLRYSVLNSSGDGTQNEKMRAVTFGDRIFLGNSFNIMPTLYWRRTNAHNSSTFFLVSNKFIYEDIGAGFRLGNEWQWKNFTMGCDWFGINKTIQKLNEQDNGINIIENMAIRKSLTFTLLAFNLGYSF